jgi:hypothetical protein
MGAWIHAGHRKPCVSCISYVVLNSSHIGSPTIYHSHLLRARGPAQARVDLPRRLRRRALRAPGFALFISIFGRLECAGERLPGGHEPRTGLCALADACAGPCAEARLPPEHRLLRPHHAL